MASNSKEPFLSDPKKGFYVEHSAGVVAESDDSDLSQPEAFSWSSVILPFLFPALGGLLFGYDIGATSRATVSLQSPELSGTTWFNLSAVQLGQGRSRELIIAALLYLFVGLITASAPDLGILLVGRALYGLGINLAMHDAPL